MDVPKMAFVQAESTLSHKRKSNLGNSFQAKRARLNKITGKILILLLNFSFLILVKYTCLRIRCWMDKSTFLRQIFITVFHLF